MDPISASEIAWGLPRLPASQTICSSRLLPMEMARDVTVVPVTMKPSFLPWGGPIWHNWRFAHSRRLCREGLPQDERPDMPADPVARHIDEAVWGGTAVNHFGHFVTDHSARLVVGALAKPDLPVIVGVVDPQADALPDTVMAVLDWYGIARDRILALTEPVQVGRLWVAPQPEQTDSGLPPQAWIDRQTAHAARRLPDPPRNGIIYVSRAGLGGHAGRMAGEAALAAALAAAGVTVVAPERLPLTDQLGLYLGAEVIVFAEGSAIHGLQLVGRVGAHAIVLNRRPRRRFGMEAIAPRVRALSFVEATSSLLNLPRLSQMGNFARGLSLPDMPVIEKTFAALGVDLTAAMPQIAAARDADITAWMSTVLRTEPDDWQARTRRAFAGRLQEAGLGHIFKAMTEMPDET